jgi:hypothetical protein
LSCKEVSKEFMVLELADSSCIMVDRGHIGLEYVYVCEDKTENCYY